MKFPWKLHITRVESEDGLEGYLLTPKRSWYMEVGWWLVQMIDSWMEKHSS